MAEKPLLLVCEGETDFYIFQALTEYFSNSNQLTVILLAPQRDATSGTYDSHGFGSVLNWCTRNKENIQMLIDFRGASALFVQMDTDIATQVNPDCVAQDYPARHCCQEKLNQKLGTIQEPPRCHYILPTQNTETWILASHEAFELDENLNEISNYELISDIEQRLIAHGYKSKKGVNRNAARKLHKNPASKYISYGKQLTNNLTIARPRCSELNRLCILLENSVAE